MKVLFLLIIYGFFAIFDVSYLIAEEKVKSDKNNLLSDTLESTIYYFSLHPGIVNNSDITSTINLTSKFSAPVYIYKGNNLIRNNISAKQNDFINIELTADEVQATTKYEYKSVIDKPTEKLYPKSAIKIVAVKSPEAVCYIKTKYGNQSDGTKLIDLKNIGKSYQVALLSKSKHLDSIPANYISIVGVNSNTYITVKLGGTADSFVRLEDGTEVKVGESFTRMINDGDVWLIPALGKADISGTMITSSTAFAVFSGSNRAYIKDSTACNYTINQELPMENWGGHSLLPPIPGRSDYEGVKVFTAQKQNTLSINGELSWSITNVGGLKGLGYIENFIGTVSKDYPNPLPVVMTSDKQFNIVVTNPGTITGKQAFPFQYNVIPTQNFTYSAVFRIENPENDKILFVYKAEKDGSIPDDILISKVFDSEVMWQPLITVSPNPGTKFFGIYPDSTHYRVKNIDLGIGTYSIKSSIPFCAYQIGDGNANYGFDLAGEINEYKYNDIYKPEIEFTNCRNCDIEGTVIEEPRIDPLNCSKIALIYLDTNKSQNVKLDVDKFDIKKAIRVNWKLSVISPNKKSIAYLTVIDNRGNRKDTVIEITSIKPTISSTNSDFGKINIKSEVKEKTEALTLKLSNSKDLTNDYEIYLMLDSDGNDNKENDINEYQQFDILSLRNINILPLMENDEIEVNIKFLAEKKGVFKDSLGVVIFEKVDGGNPKPIKIIYLSELNAISGSNSIKVENYNFGNVSLNKSNEVELSILNNATNTDETNFPLVINGTKLTGNDIGYESSKKPFKIYGLENISTQNPLVLQAKESVKFKVLFTPDEQREFSGIIEFESDNIEDVNKSVISGMGITTSVQNSTENNFIKILTIDNTIRFISSDNYFVNTIEIYNLSGEIVYSENINQQINNYSINQRQFTTGVYILKFLIENKWISQKIIIN